MAPRSKVDFVYVHLSYVPSRKANEKVCEILTRHDKPKMSEFLISQQDWAVHIISTEISKLPKDKKVRFTEWRFATSAFELFILENIFYDKILLILGEDSVYWTFYMQTPYGRRIQGRAALPLSYCACCIHEQYVKILSAIKEHAKKCGLLGSQNVIA